MNYRNTVMLSTEAMAASGTKIIDLTLSDIISRITIFVAGKNTAVAPTAHPAKMISRIELVAGSDVLWGLSGSEALALMFYQNKETPYVQNWYKATWYCQFCIDINFGRFLWDKLLAFDPKKFTNPQLKITYDRAAGGAAPDEGQFKVMADVFDQKEISPIGFLSAKEIVSYTMAANSNEYVDVPLDRLLKSLIVFPRKGATAPLTHISTIKLSEDNDKRILWDDTCSQIIKNNGNLYPLINEHFFSTGAAAHVVVYCMSAYNGNISAVVRENMVGVIEVYQPQDAWFHILSPVDKDVHGVITGRAPFGSLIMPFGDPSDLDDWYDVSKVGSLVLRIKAGGDASASNTCEVVTEQLRKYAA